MVVSGTLVSAHKVLIDNGPRFRKRLLFCKSQDVIRLCSQKSRAWIYVRLPTGSVLHGAQSVSSILNITRFGHGFVLRRHLVLQLPKIYAAKTVQRKGEVDASDRGEQGQTVARPWPRNRTAWEQANEMRRRAGDPGVFSCSFSRRRSRCGSGAKRTRSKQRR